MIPVDTAALMAIVVAEPRADGCIDACRLPLYIGDDFVKTEIEGVL
jgi:uncharacterized protein with PIN domain